MPVLKQILKFNNQIFLLSILFVHNSVCPAQAQQVIFNNVSPDLYLGNVNGATQDRQGYIWFCSFVSGLYRYDGYHLTTFRNDPRDSRSLSGNYLLCVYTDHNGFIWIGTGGSGLDRFDPGTGIFTHFSNKKDELTSLSDDEVTAIQEDHEGSLWVGTRNGLNRMDSKTGTFTRFFSNSKDSSTLSYNRVQVLHKDRQGTLWVGCADAEYNDESQLKGGLNRWDSKSQKFKRYEHNPKDPASLMDNRIGAIFEDSRGAFWVSTAGDGLHTMDREKGRFERHAYDPAHPEKLSGPPLEKDALMNLTDFFIQEDGSGAIWIGSTRGWITRYDPKTKKANHFDSFNGDAQAVQRTTAAFTSRDGVLWLTTGGGKIYRVDPFQVTIPHFVLGDYVHAIHEDVSGLLWLGTWKGGLIQTDRRKRTMKRFYTDPPGRYTLPDSWIPAFYEGDDSTLWIGSGNGLYQYNRKTKIFTHYANDSQDRTSLTKGFVTAISGDKPGSLWIATAEGLNRFDIKSRKCTRYLHDPKDSTSLGDNNVSALLKDHSGNLWAGTWNGILNLFNSRTEKFKRFPCSEGIGSITEDAENIIWVGTSNGLYQSNPAVDTFLQYSRPEIGLTTTTIVTCILEDNKKHLWVGSSAGILRLDSNRNNISVYRMNQGVDPSGLSFPLMRGTKGIHDEFFFGDRLGYYAFFPDQFKNNTTPPQVIISDFRLADQLVKPGKGSPLAESITQTKEISLNYNQNVFSFDFAGMHYSSPEDNQHLFMMENLDNNWRKAGPEKRAYYYNVPPDKYKFRVKVSNSYGVWAEKAITIIITPPWWSNWWVRVAAVVCIATIFYAIIRWRLHQKFRRQLERSEKEKQFAELQHKTAELEMQALRAQMNPHFIFNSLNSINMFILENNKQEASDYLSKFSKLVRMILQHSQEAFIPLDSELEALRLYLELESLRFGQRFEYKILVNEVDSTMVKVPPLIIQPYAENAIWHGLMHLPGRQAGKKEKGHLEIELYLKDKILFCKITDDGIGRKKAAELRSKSSLANKSMGMRITADRVAILQQEHNENFISVKDLVYPDGRAAGTEVLIKIPVRYD